MGSGKFDTSANNSSISSQVTVLIFVAGSMYDYVDNNLSSMQPPIQGSFYYSLENY